MGVVEKVFLDRLNNIYALLAFEYAYFVASVHKQDYCEQNAKKGPHFCMQSIFPLLNAHLKCLAEFILGEQHFSYVAVLSLPIFLHLLNNYKN